MGGEAWRRNPTRGLQHKCRNESGKDERSALTSAKEKCRSECRVDDHDFQRETIDAGDGCDPRERNVVDLSDTEQVPRESANACARKFDCNPNEGREHDCGALRPVGQQADNDAKSTVIEGEIEAK